jgi:hypothetical protein
MKRMIGSTVVLLILATLACGQSSGEFTEPPSTVSPLVIGDDLASVDVCAAIPLEDIEAVMGRELESDPEPMSYYDTPETNGCAYSAGKDSDGTAYFGYVILTPIEVYHEQPLYLDEEVAGIGRSAYFNNGADARQLWVNVDDNLAFVVAFGDLENEEGAKAIARLVVAAIQ